MTDFLPEILEDESSVKMPVPVVGGVAVKFFLKSRIRLPFRFSAAKSKGVDSCLKINKGYVIFGNWEIQHL